LAHNRSVAKWINPTTQIMKTTRLLLLSLALLMASQFTYSQSTPPAGMTGNTLRVWFKINWFDGKHSTLGYNGARRAIYSYVDERGGQVSCVYTGFSQAAANVTFLNPINAEHSIPQSWFGEASPMVADIHHLYPTHLTVNGARSNYPFGENTDSNTDKWYIVNGTNTGLDISTSTPSSNIDDYSELDNNSPLNGSNVFEPIEFHKGNLARAIFYFYTMYPTQAGNITAIVADGDIDLLYQWHLQDPVDANEITRNNRAEERQGNRNPYIDYPDAVADAWEFTSSGNAPVAPTASLVANSSTLTINWGDVSEETGYKIFRSLDNSVFTEYTSLSANFTTYTDNAVTVGTQYYYYVEAFNGIGSNNSNTVNGTPTGAPSGGGGSISELIISEYVEGSSFNKAIEIANFTGASVDLSDYSLKKEANGSGGFTDELTLSGALANGEVYVVAKSTASAAILALADFSTGSSVIDFNGNDPIGLFKNGALIDIVGTLNGGSTSFAANKTLVRKLTVTAPNTTYTVAEWDELSTDDISDLGSHTASGSGGGGGSNELLISEYVEGSGNNKAIEIANFTGATVDLSDYSLQRAVNGSATWTDMLSLSGTLASGDVYVLVNNSADAATKANAELQTTSAVLQFNGDDAVGLFKATTLIDIVGVLGNGANIYANKTLIRKSIINSPNTTYTVAEWDEFAQDYITDLGSHSLTPTTIWKSTGWSNGTPTQTMDVIVEFAYNTTTSGSFACLDLTINTGFLVSVGDGTSVTVYGNLENNGSVIVKNEGSLVQDSDMPTNSGTGSYTVEKEGRDSQKVYSYWGSPVQGATVQDIFGASGTNLYGYNSASQSWFGLTGATTLIAGEGTIATGTSATETIISRDFVSSVGFNSGDYSMASSYNDDGGANSDIDNDWNLLGNPYPSGISVATFLTDNAAVLASGVYVWNSDGNDYTSASTDYAIMNTMGVANAGGGALPTSANIASCQGFFVRTIANGTIEFNNKQRSNINNTFLRTQTEDLERIWIEVTSEEKVTNEILIGFTAEAKLEVDKYDALKLVGNANLAFYSQRQLVGVKSNDEKLAIQGLPSLKSLETTIVPLGLKVKTEMKYTFSISRLEDFAEDNEVYLYDAVLDLETNLRTSDYAVQLSEGTHEDRFELRVISNRITSEPTDLKLESVKAFAHSKQINIKFASAEFAKSNIIIYDLMGRVIYNQLNESALELTIPVESSNIYILKVENKEGVLVQKLGVE
jgi:hypothetical protein